MTTPSLLTRRQLVATAGVVAATAGILTEAIARADNAALNVEDRASAIKITSLATFPVGVKTIIRIDTNQKISGWGEISQLPPKAAGALAESIYDLLDGENPTRIEYLWQK